MVHSEKSELDLEVGIQSPDLKKDPIFAPFSDLFKAFYNLTTLEKLKNRGGVKKSWIVQVQTLPEAN